VCRGRPVLLHAEALAFAGHYGFVIWLAARYRAQSKSRVERQVELVRRNVLSGREFASLHEMDRPSWPGCPTAARLSHCTRARSSPRADRDRVALSPLPERPLRGLRPETRWVGKDALSPSGPAILGAMAARSAPGSRVELRVTPAEVRHRATAQTCGRDHPQSRPVTD
jgi:hypothetical protein